LNAKSGKSNNPSKNTQTISLTRESLAKLKQKAVRRGLWFKELKQNERELLNLTIKVVKKIHSFILAKLVSKIVEKLFVSMKSIVYRVMETKGHDLAEKLAHIALSWGNKSAKSWPRNRSFIQYLTVTHLLS
jgi:hypothetical protein